MLAIFTVLAGRAIRAASAFRHLDAVLRSRRGDGRLGCDKRGRASDARTERADQEDGFHLELLSGINMSPVNSPALFIAGTGCSL